MRSNARLVGLLAVLIAGACAPDHYHCTQSTECMIGGVNGMCESDGTCSFPDTTCPSGRRFASGTGTSGEECVSVDATDMPAADMSAAANCHGTNAAFCAGVCTSTASDPSNCGSCGHACATGEFCQTSVCTNGCTLTTCGALCVDTNTDDQNCHDCGNACAAGQACVSGTCSCPTATPNACGTGASALCTNTQTDPNHCGDCATVCIDGTACVSGHCASGSDDLGSCTSSFTLCNNACIDTQTDPNNCHSCGNACAIGQQCIAGSCSCPIATPTACALGETARFTNPFSAAADNSGNLFIADSGNNAIRKLVIATGEVSTLAGGNAGSADGTGTNAQFSYPQGVSIDNSGNLFVADTANHTIRKVAIATGMVATLAGSAGHAGSTDGVGSSARFWSPADVSADHSGSVLVSDSGNETIRKIVIATGQVSTVAGAPGQYGHVDGTGSSARFSYPQGVSTDNAGNLFVADRNNPTIRKVVVASGVVSTLAGGGPFGGQDGIGTSASFSYPVDVSTDNSGNLFVADTYPYVSSTIRKVVIATAQVSTIAGGQIGFADGTGTHAHFGVSTDAVLGLSTDDAGNLLIADTGNQTIRKMVIATAAVTTLAGAPEAAGNSDSTSAYCANVQTDANNCGACAMICAPGSACQNGACVGGCGGAFCTNDQACYQTSYGVSDCMAKQTDCAGTWCCSPNDGFCPTMALTGEYIVFCSSQGCVNDNNTYTPACVDTNSDPHNCGGCANNGYYGSDCTQRNFVTPVCLNGSCVDLSDDANNCGSVGNVCASGCCSSAACGTGDFTTDVHNCGTCGNDCTLYDGVLTPFCSNGSCFDLNSDPNNCGTIGTVCPSGCCSQSICESGGDFSSDVDNCGACDVVCGANQNCIAGTCECDAVATPDSCYTGARFYDPEGVSADHSGNLFVADGDGESIRKVVIATGEVSLFVGGQYGTTDGTGTSASFYHPTHLSIDNSGNMFVADTYNYTIRKVVLATAQVSTLAGTAGQSGSVDGIATIARFASPQGVSADNSGNLFVADTSINTVRKIVIATGQVSTLAGAAGQYGTADGTGTSARFSYVSDVSADGSGNLFVADTDNCTIRKIVTATGAVTTFVGLPQADGDRDGTGASAYFYFPAGVSVDNAGNLFVSDNAAATIRKVVIATTAVSTLAGSAQYVGSADGIGSSARFSNSLGVSADNLGNLFVADIANYAVRRVQIASGQVSTFAGKAGRRGGAKTIASSCTNLQTAVDNCGGCNISCGASQTCVAGACQ